MCGMKRTVVEIRDMNELFFHRRSLEVFLRFVGFVCLLLALPFILSSGSPSALASSQGTARPAPPMQPLIAVSSHVDIVLVIDNVGGIKAFDPAGARFLAAQMFVNQAQIGSSIGVVRIT